MNIFENISTMGHEQVVFCQDRHTGLKAIIAIHDTTLGPALGGSRMWDYKSEEDALNDVLRLSRGMTYKAAVAGLNLGGGKAVLIGDPKQLKSEAYFRTFGRFVNSLSGRYITAEDVNINVNDMEYVAMETPFATGISSFPGGSGDPSPFTALGVFSGIRAAVKYKLNKDSLKGLRVAVQGCGSVGRHLLELLHREGASLVVADIDKTKVDQMSHLFKAQIVDVHSIHSTDCDVFAPCALGAVLNDVTIPQLKTPIVAGGANNQLQNEDVHGPALRQKGILYAPDYVINAGGLINVYQELRGYSKETAAKQATGIYDTLLKVFQEADRSNIPTHKASNQLAERRIEAVRHMGDLRNRRDNLPWFKK